jgi:Xaa-Pro aminopeptidase
MKMKNTALLVGPYDWDPVMLPVAEFEVRLAAVRRVLAERGATALLVHGDSVEHGALAYLTGFTPKLGPAFALVPREGPLRILASGGAGMMSSAKRLTWVEDVRPIDNLRNALSEWLTEFSGGSPAVLGLWGTNAIAQRPYQAASAAIQPSGQMIELDDALDSLRRCKSPQELQLLREACRALDCARRAFERAAEEGAGSCSAALAAERAGYANGAQDVRILAGARDGGPPQPLDLPADACATPLLVCLAVRFAGYWAEGLVTIPAASGGAVARAEAALSAMLREARPGATSDDLLRAAASQLPPYRLHRWLESALGNGIGLSLEETPILGRDVHTKLEEGGVYVLRCGASGKGSDNAVISAVVSVSLTGSEVLWSGSEQTAS